MMVQLQPKQFGKHGIYNNRYLHLPNKYILLVVNKCRSTNMWNMQEFVSVL
jgi:hypothetical protein